MTPVLGPRSLTLTESSPSPPCASAAKTQKFSDSAPYLPFFTKSTSPTLLEPQKFHLAPRPPPHPACPASIAAGPPINPGTTTPSTIARISWPYASSSVSPTIKGGHQREQAQTMQGGRTCRDHIIHINSPARPRPLHQARPPRLYRQQVGPHRACQTPPPSLPSRPAARPRRSP